MNYWTIPRLFESATVAVLASGPSMSQAVADAVSAAGVPVIAVNSTYRLARNAWAVYAADSEWWKHPTNRDVFELDALKVSVWTGTPVRDVLYLRRSNDDAFCPEQDCVATLGHSGGQAIQLAAKTGAKRILLLGFDMRVTPEACHWHGEHPAGLRKTDPGVYASWIARIEKIAPALAKRGIEVLNCTEGSALRCFPMMGLEDALCAVR